MKAISYSLFGYQKARQENCFDFHSYLRGLMLNLRLNRLIYPDWMTILQTDQNTYNGFINLFGAIDKWGQFKVRLNDEAPLTKAMLWRMKPIFELDGQQKKVFSHVLCRDLDSPTTYREAQAVKYWMNRDKAVHAITDSVSHDRHMLGGMIGFVPAHFTMLSGYQSWDAMFSGCSIDFARKGADQDFLNQYIYPKFAQQGHDSITQHYFLGMPNSFLSDYKTCQCRSTVGHDRGCLNDIDLGLPATLKESNGTCGHIGSAGWYETSMFKFLRPYWNQFDDLLEAEKKHANIFYWANE